MREMYGKEYFDIRDVTIDKSEWSDILLFIKGKFILEVGCGTGKLLEFLMKKGYVVMGCDISKYAANIAKKKGLRVDICNAENLPYPDKCFDTVISQHLLEHVPNDVKALKEMVRVALYRVICLVPGHQTNDKTHVRDHYTLQMILYLIERVKREIKNLTFVVLPDSHSLKYPNDWDWIIIVDKI